MVAATPCLALWLAPGLGVQAPPAFWTAMQLSAPNAYSCHYPGNRALPLEAWARVPPSVKHWGAVKLLPVPMPFPPPQTPNPGERRPWTRAPPSTATAHARAEGQNPQGEAAHWADHGHRLPDVAQEREPLLKG